MTAPPADRGLAGYVRRTVYPYSAHYRAVLDATGVGRRVRRGSDLARVPATDLGALTDPGALVLRPDLGRIMRHGRPALAAWAVAARVSGGMHGFSRHVERRFKPIMWVLADGVPIGYAAADVSRLARRGAAWLGRAGVRRDDVVVSLLDPGPSVAHRQLELGCRRAGVSAIHLDPGADPGMIERLVPSVLVGEPTQLSTLLTAARHSGRALGSISTVIAVGGPLGAERRGRLRELSGGAVVVGAWAPAGVRALWSECRAGAGAATPAGYHAWDDDVLEASVPGAGGAEGEILWTGVGWGGSALLRMRTFAVATSTHGRCPACGARGVLVVPHAPVPRAGAAAVPATVAFVAPVDAVAVPAAVPAAGSTVAAWIPTAHPPAAVAAPAGPPAPPPLIRPPVAIGAPVAEVFDTETEVAAWQVEYRSVAGAPETIVTLAPAWGAAVVPLIRRLDRHVRATQFVVLSLDDVLAKVEADGGRRVVGVPGA